MWYTLRSRIIMMLYYTGGLGKVWGWPFGFYSESYSATITAVYGYLTPDLPMMEALMMMMMLVMI